MGTDEQFNDMDVQEYDAVFSLGSNCQTAYQLRRLSLRREAGPLDWFVSKNIDQLIRLIDARFAGFMDLGNLEKISAFRTCYCVRDTRYGILSYHDFPITEKEADWALAYPEFKSKLCRRTERMLQAWETGERLLFVRVNGGQDDGDRLYYSLKKQVKHFFDLIIIDTLADENAPVSSWAEPSGCIRYSIPKGKDWRGSDGAWNKLLESIRLRHRLSD
ncbi:DUF1796 family putative cysteine peptidase [Paenibacillus sp. PDC88]|uniref:DUF1796 family putative cysteine peptidase n=1 Tax=Paenibacillus sp. PDC88 TaxID=1884375 RepID=UPI00089A125B|nr:DUF1796 family putative cysteine peptidase [Paenibacillus sp. PDC88]SDW19087.1 Putative papain-like cysteine peptidase [Paenibacillus sp. PDC88]